MGNPLPPPVDAEDIPDASINEDSEAEDSEPEEAWFQEEAAQEWEDPSIDGVLSRLLTAAEEGNADQVAALLGSLSVSVNTRVRRLTGIQRCCSADGRKWERRWGAAVTQPPAAPPHRPAGRRRRHRTPPCGVVWPYRLRAGAAGTGRTGGRGR